MWQKSKSFRESKEWIIGKEARGEEVAGEGAAEQVCWESRRVPPPYARSRKRASEGQPRDK